MTGYKNKLLKDAEILEKKAYQQFKHIFPLSEYVKKDLINHYEINPDKITVVGSGLGIIKPYFEKKDYQNNKILFTAKGRFKDKGGLLVLEAFKKAYDKNPNLQLTIVGQNDYNKKIDHPGIKTLGFVSIQILQELFNSHSLFLMPATNEPWGLVYLEALACKTPIMGLNRNAFPELSGHGKYGYILNNETPEELAGQLLKVMNSHEELKQKGEAGQKYCLENFSWENTTEKIIAKIQQLSLE
jgi:glycosyltransferase involved in cell wall biosynthesis